MEPLGARPRGVDDSLASDRQHLSLHDARRVAAAPPAFSRPRQIGCFRKDEAGRVKFGETTHCRQFRMPRLPVDLNSVGVLAGRRGACRGTGYEAYVRKEFGRRHPLYPILGVMTKAGLRGRANRASAGRESQCASCLRAVGGELVESDGESSCMCVAIGEGAPPPGLTTSDAATIPSKPELSQYASARLDPRVSVVSYRNNLNKIMGMAFCKDAFSVRVTSTPSKCIFLDIVEMGDPSELSEERLRSEYWGYSFESACTVPLSGNTPDSSRSNAVANPNLEFCSVVSFQIGEIGVVIGAEIDCRDAGSPPGQPVGATAYRELKTCRQLLHDRQVFSFERYKLSKWWIQSFLAGVEHVDVGFLNDDGVVTKIQHFQTKEMPRMVGRHRRSHWDAAVAVSCLHNTLAWLLAATWSDRTLFLASGGDEQALLTYSLDFRSPFTCLSLSARSVFLE